MEQFIKNLIESIFGFTPEIEIYNPNGNVFLVYLNGDEEQRKMMVGKMGANIITIKDLMKIYDRYNLTRTTLEVKRYDNQTDTQVNPQSNEGRISDRYRLESEDIVY